MKTGTVFAASPAGARRFLLEILHPDGRPASGGGRTAAASVDWENLLRLARMNKVEGLVAGRLKDLEPAGPLPEETRRVLDGIHAAGLEGATKYERTASEVRALFEKARVPHLIVKGAVFASSVYGDPVRRPSYDVDFVVPRRFVERADRVLVGAGYEMLKPRVRHLLFAPLGVRRSLRRGGKLPPDRAREVYLDHHYHFPFVLPAGDDRLPIDLHWQLTHDRVWNAGEDEIWAETEERGDGLRTLGREATLVYLAVHALEQGAEGVKLRDFVDLAWAMKAYRKGAAPAEALDLAGRWGVSGHLSAAAEAVAFLFPGAAEGFREGGTGPRWPARCFRSAGFPGLLWEKGEPDTKLGRLSRRLARQAFWDLALRRPPRAASRTLLAYLLGANPPPRERQA